MDAYRILYWDRIEDEPAVVIMSFGSQGKLMAYFQPGLEPELVNNHWTLLVKLDGETGEKTVEHSQINNIDELIAANPAYNKISAIRNAIFN